MTIRHINFDARLLQSVQTLVGGEGDFNATLDAHGLYNTFQFVLRLSPAVHRTIAALPSGIVSSQEATFEGTLAFSTYLHETIHWWQYVGSTYGLMLSLSYPAQAHANYKHLKELLAKIGFKKSVRDLANILPPPGGPDTLRGLANIIVNNHFDFSAFRAVTHSERALKTAVEDPYFESVGHAFQMTYAANLVVLAATVDPDFSVIQHPKNWEAPFRALRGNKEPGYYFTSPIEVWPLGALEIMEGQACFSQIQYLAFASGGRLNWDDFRALGILHGVYVKAFDVFLKEAGLEWPPQVDHPTVGLFLLICDMALNPGSGFPHTLMHFSSFITDIAPGARFVMLSAVVRLKCPGVVSRIKNYTREEYRQVTEELSVALLIDSPLSIAVSCSNWISEDGPLASFMDEYRTFDYQPRNLPVRVLFSHFLAFMRDKYITPEFFCWPGAWMAGDRVSPQTPILFERHSALFIDKEHDDGIFPRMPAGRDEQLVQKVFDNFYAMNVTYDMTHQWITQPGPFTYNYRWLSQTGAYDDIRAFADRNFEHAYGVYPSMVELL